MRPHKYPFDALGTGDAFDVPIASTTRPALTQLCRLHGRRLKCTFVVRNFPDEGVYEVSRGAELPSSVSLRKQRPKRLSEMTKAEMAALIDEARLTLDKG